MENYIITTPNQPIKRKALCTPIELERARKKMVDNEFNAFVEDLEAAEEMEVGMQNAEEMEIAGGQEAVAVDPE